MWAPIAIAVVAIRMYQNINLGRAPFTLVKSTGKNSLQWVLLLKTTSEKCSFLKEPCTLEKHKLIHKYTHPINELKNKHVLVKYTKDITTPKILHQPTLIA
jgi:hypothetical protein